MNMRTGWISVAVVLVAVSAAHARASDDESKRIGEAVGVLEESRSTPDKAIPADIWHRAQSVVVISGLKGGVRAWRRVR